MWFYPPDLSSWWSKLPWWGKVLLVVPVAALVIVLVAWAMTGGAITAAFRKADPAGRAVRDHEKMVDGEVAKAESRDEEIRKRIDAIESLKGASRDERNEEAEERRDVHREIDGAGSIADINRVLRDGRGSRDD